MARQNHTTDMQSILQSMLERLKFNSAESILSQQQHGQQCTQHTDRNIGNCEPALTLREINTGEQSQIGSDDVQGHTKYWGVQGSAEVPSLHTSARFRESVSTEEDASSPDFFPMWKRRKVVPHPAPTDVVQMPSHAENIMTERAIYRMDTTDEGSFHNRPRGYLEVTNQTCPHQSDLGMIPEENLANNLASSPDLWNEIKWRRSTQNESDESFRSVSQLQRLDACPTYESGMGRKKIKRVDRKTLRWVQKIKRSWKERQTTVKRREEGVSCEGEQDKGDHWEAKNVKHPGQESSRADIFNEVHPGRGASYHRQDFSGQVSSSIPMQLEWKRVGRKSSDFQNNFSPIKLEEIFTRDDWSNFPSNKERPNRLKPTNPSYTKLTSWLQHNPSSGETNMMGDQADQSGSRTHQDGLEENNNNMQGNTSEMSPLDVPVKDEDANEITMSEACDSFSSRYEQDQEEAMEGSFSFDFLRSVEVLDNSIPKSRIALNRQRVHRARKQRVRDRTRRNGGVESWMFRDSAGFLRQSSTSESQRQDFKVSTSLRRVTKMRNMRDPAEDTRHVHFAEVLVTHIPDPPPYEEGAPELSLPSWIAALKKRKRKIPN